VNTYGTTSEIVTIALDLDIFRVVGRRGSAKESAVDIVPL
jgi:hypothetical protein